MYEVGCVSPILSNCGDVGAIFHLIALHGALRGFLAIGDKQQTSDYGADCNEAMEYGEASMKETRIECFRAGDSTLSYCLPQVLRITCSGVLRTLISAYLDTGKKRCLKIGKSHKMKKLAYFWAAGYCRRSCSVISVIPYLYEGGDGRAAQRFKQMIESPYTERALVIGRASTLRESAG